MKNHHAWIVSLVLGGLGAWAAEQRPVTPTFGDAPVSVAVSQPKIVERWTDGRTWERFTTNTYAGGKTAIRTNRWKDLATGMHFWDQNHWKESRTDIDITAEGAEARNGPHKVKFAGNINTVGAIEITTRDAKTLKARVIGLAYTDLATGESVLIATVRDADGLLFPPATVLYPAAFSGLLADIRYSYSRHGCEQDVILRENPPPPSEYGLSNETTALEVWTEFDAPEPAKQPRTLGGISDETISFGKMRLGRGGAFSLDAPVNRMSATPVGKTWLKANGTQYLIESVPHGSVATELDKLPQLRAGLQRAPAVQRAAGLQPAGLAPAQGAAGFPSADPAAIVKASPANGLNLPVENRRHVASSRTAQLAGVAPPKPRAVKPVRLAVNSQALDRRAGLVLDFVLIEGEYDSYIFQADTTYLISGTCNFYEAVVFEGGSVIKVSTTNESIIYGLSSIEWKTDPYRPVIFTSQNDPTVGADLTASGSPMKYYAALSGYGQAEAFKHVRISHAQYGLTVAGNFKLRDAQFTDCDNALYGYVGAGDIDNVLFYQVGRAFTGSWYTNHIRHATIDQCAQLSHEFVNTNYSRLAFTNSLLVNVSNFASVSITTNYTVTTTSNPFQTVGAGAHYLADDSPYRGAGTTNVPATLAARLKQTTTYPPLIIAPSNFYYGVSETWFPRAGRDTDLPDLGAHYDPIDYAVFALFLTNATIQVEPGTVIAAFSPSNSPFYAFAPGQDGKFQFNGRAEAKITVTPHSTVQEMANTNWNGPLLGLAISFENPSGAEMRFRHTDFTGLGGVTPLAALPAENPAWQFSDCQFHSGTIIDYSAVVAFTNCLFNRCVTDIEPITDLTNYFYNCTFYGGAFTGYFSDTNHARMHDTLFVDTTMTGGEMISSHIGYLGSARLTPTNTNDVVLGSLVFQTGPLGYFYIPSNALVNAGSRNATNAGLYHYTMLTNNVKETNTTVDIGFHYAATDANGTPLDYDGDGVPDYWEDRNGNGAIGSGETDWRDALDWGLRVFITRPRNGSTIP